MDQKFLKRFISECPLTDFSENGNFTERELKLDKDKKGILALANEGHQIITAQDIIISCICQRKKNFKLN